MVYFFYGVVNFRDKAGFIILALTFSEDRVYMKASWIENYKSLQGLLLV